MRTDPAPAAVALIDAAALAELLSVSKPTVWRLLAAGKLPQPIRFSAQCLRWRLTGLDGIDAWLAANCPDAETWVAMTEGRA
jgi:predicted DNA-binding transcriptional regulator AlpA